MPEFVKASPGALAPHYWRSGPVGVARGPRHAVRTRRQRCRRLCAGLCRDRDLPALGPLGADYADCRRQRCNGAALGVRGGHPDPGLRRRGVFRAGLVVAVRAATVPVADCYSRRGAPLVVAFSYRALIPPLNAAIPVRVAGGIVRGLVVLLCSPLFRWSARAIRQMPALRRRRQSMTPASPSCRPMRR